MHTKNRFASVVRPLNVGQDLQEIKQLIKTCPCQMCMELLCIIHFVLRCSYLLYLAIIGIFDIMGSCNWLLSYLKCIVTYIYPGMFYMHESDFNKYYFKFKFWIVHTWARDRDNMNSTHKIWPHVCNKDELTPWAADIMWKQWLTFLIYNATVINMTHI